jgi:hypothetical protein
MPEFTNEVQHQLKVLSWEQVTVTSLLKSGVRLPAFMKAGNRFGKSRQLWIARHRASRELKRNSGVRVAKLGETIIETLKTIPRSWKVIQHVGEKFTCRDCEKISPAQTPFHVIPLGGRAPASWRCWCLRNSARISAQPAGRAPCPRRCPLSISTFADQVGARCAVLEPIFNLIVMASATILVGVPDWCTIFSRVSNLSFRSYQAPVYDTHCRGCSRTATATLSLRR